MAPAFVSNTWKPKPLPVTRNGNDCTGWIARAGEAIEVIATTTSRERSRGTAAPFARSVPRDFARFVAHFDPLGRFAPVAKRNVRRSPRAAIRDARSPTARCLRRLRPKLNDALAGMALEQRAAVRSVLAVAAVLAACEPPGYHKHTAPDAPTGGNVDATKPTD